MARQRVFGAGYRSKKLRDIREIETDHDCKQRATAAENPPAHKAVCQFHQKRERCQSTVQERSVFWRVVERAQRDVAIVRQEIEEEMRQHAKPRIAPSRARPTTAPIDHTSNAAPRAVSTECE